MTDLGLPTKEQQIERLNKLIEQKTARFYWLQTEAGNLEAAIPDERARLVFIAHLLGASLDTLGETLHVTRERARQIILKVDRSIISITDAHPIP